MKVREKQAGCLRGETRGVQIRWRWTEKRSVGTFRSAQRSDIMAIQAKSHNFEKIFLIGMQNFGRAQGLFGKCRRPIPRHDIGSTCFPPLPGTWKDRYHEAHLNQTECYPLRPFRSNKALHG
jgi:hypothetical protein